MAADRELVPQRPRDRERIVRTLTFWLRPEFVLRLINRFQKVVGFDRSMALASSALTAIIPLTIVLSAFGSLLGGKDTAQRIIDRYDLSGGGAEAVRDMFSPPSGTSTSIGVLGFIFLLVAVLSFTRAMQRLFEQTWELKPLSVRNSANGLLWAGGLVLYIGLGGFLQAVIDGGDLEITATLLTAPVSFVFLVLTGRMLTAKRLPARALLPFAISGTVLIALYSVGSNVYLPHLFNTYATRYGVIGAVFAMISALFCLMFVLVVSAAGGREIQDELDRIRRGEKPAPDEVRRQWNEIIDDMRARWETVRVQVRERRRRRADK
jgi:membrane protein